MSHIVVRAKRIRPNPYRDIKKYPVDKEKVEALKHSIDDTGFWGNILVRPHPDKPGYYQLAYGHHRLVAIRKLGLEEVEVILREHISEAEMVRIMAEENNQWTTSPAVINQTVETVKNFLDGEIAKYKTYEEFREKCLLPTVDIFEGHFVTQGPNKGKPSNPKALFGQAKKPGGVGLNAIHRFLGKNWSRFKIEQALDTISRSGDDGDLDRDAVETFPSTGQASAFKSAMKFRKVPKQEQKALAEKILADEVKRSKRKIRDAVDEELRVPEPEPADPVIARLERLWDRINAEASALSNKIGGFCAEINEMTGGAGKLVGSRVDETAINTYELYKSLESLFQLFDRGGLGAHRRSDESRKLLSVVTING